MATPIEQWLPGMNITAARLEAMNQRSWLMVTNYGADSSGAVNSDAAIQLALNDARDRGGAWVLVPPGIYLLGATLRIYTNTRLTLMQGAEFRRNHGGTMLINGDAAQTFGGYTGHSRITVEGGLWNMRGTTSGMTSSAMCMSFGHCEDILVRDLEIRDLPGFHAIELNSTNHGTVTNCKFRGYIDPGGRDFSEAIQIDLAKSSSVFGGFGPYDHTESKDITIQGCHFGDSGTAGTTAWPRGIGSHSATITKWHRRIRIAGCSFENLTQYAISAYNWEDVTITGNTFVSCGSGVRIRSVIKSDTEDTKMPDGTQTSESQVMRNITVVGNSFRNGLAYDNVIVAQGEVTTGTILNLAIVGNTIDGTTGGQAGIRLNYVSRCTVADNVVANTNGSGISTENQNNTIVNGNVVWTVENHGITMVSSDNSNIVNNQIRDPGDSGILVQGGSDIQIRNNFVQGANKLGGTNYGIRISTSANSVTTTGNKVRPNTSGTNATYAYSATNTVTNAQRYGNDFRPLGASWGTGAIDAGEVSPNTSATDITA
ncbi:right-handed parallel beta-helix repeat-containing protein [Streptomyces sp. SP17KL33]|uniref:right-handed parallel beta-helix repeat-containing protein n=1 Tax=Streptomyces sp. SP17KL33 TaxID=3002534 RepID=UPI002E77846C|nr:right-handed parallel beta-helix repeat-containing protein [Streptomyces sp. SP17KL33]MEE1835765.1 right-handed parallel beta-helix repeat-containing protein [Streptomyces sp. SP17KL33]